jgi:hypothetical protein
MPTNYAVEARIHEMLADNGVLEVAHQDFIDEFRAGLFTEQSALAHIKAARTQKPHRWVISGTEDDELFVSAFGQQRTLTAQGEVIKKFGEDRAKEIAAQFGTTLGSIKPGTVPATNKSANGHDKNPFVGLRDKSGKIVPEKMKAVESLLRGIGSAKTAAIARSAGLRLDGTPIDPKYL